MLKIISDLASIATLVLFIIYFVGRFFRIKGIKSTLREEYRIENEPETSELLLPYFVDLTNGSGEYFSVSSSNGFKRVSFYDAVLDVYGNANKGELIKKFDNVFPNEKVYAKVDIPDTTEACFVEIEKNDYVKISFGIADNGYDGALIKTGYKIKMPIKAWLYYLCS